MLGSGCVRLLIFPFLLSSYLYLYKFNTKLIMYSETSVTLYPSLDYPNAFAWFQLVWIIEVALYINHVYRISSSRPHAYYLFQHIRWCVDYSRAWSNQGAQSILLCSLHYSTSTIVVSTRSSICVITMLRAVLRERKEIDNFKMSYFIIPRTW